MKKKKPIRVRCSFVALFILLAAGLAARAGVTNLTVSLPLIDFGNYDGNGEHGALEQDPTAGKVSYQPGRNPRRSWLAFSIPNFPGTITGAVLRTSVSAYGAYVVSSNATQNFELREVATPVATLRRGGLGQTNIFADLADGALYAALTLPTGNVGFSPVLNANFLAAVNAARGSELALGGSIPGLNLNSPTQERVSILYGGYYLRLELQLSVPQQPSIYAAPAPNDSLGGSNAVYLTVGASGAAQLTYRWFLNGVPTVTEQDFPHYYVQNVSGVAKQVFVTVSNAFGVATSAVVQVKVGPELFHLNFPSLVARVDDYVPLYVQSSYFYQYNTTWYKDGVFLGALGPSWTLPTARTNDAGDYRAVVTGAFGSVTTAVARLDVVETPPLIWQHPAGASVPAGGTLSASVTVVGGPKPAVRWFRDGAFVPGQTNQTLTIYGAQLSDAGNYFVTASNYLGVVTSQVAAVTVYLTAPYITQQPTNQSVPAGGTAQFQIGAYGNPSPVLRWFHDGAPAAGMSPSNTAPYRIYNVTAADAGSYYCVVSNISGVATSQSATLTVFSSAPSFALQPANQNIYYGGTAQFQPSASGIPTPSYRWYHDGVLIPTNSSATLTVPNATTPDLGSYFCVASNASGVATSLVATLTLISVPPILGGPADVTLLAGNNAYFLVIVDNPGAPIGYQWQRDGVNLTNTWYYPDQFIIQNPQPADAGQYRVIVTNLFGASTSRVATLTITTAPPVVTSFYISASNVVEGTAVVISGSASGGPVPQLKLLHNGQAIYTPNIFPGFGSWYLPAVTLAGAGDYTLVASNSVGVVTTTISLSVQRAGPLDQWTLRNPLPQGRDLHSVVWGQNQFVAVGDNGALVTSPNGTNWTAHNTQTAESIYSVAYGNGRFVAVTRYGTGRALTSTNGDNWESTMVQSNAAFFDVTFGNGTFFAVGEIGSPYTPVAFRSTNGTDWSAVTIPLVTNAFPLTATFGAGRFLAVDYSGVAYSSTDLLTWTSAANIMPYAPYTLGSAYVNGVFIVAGNDGLLNSSADGLTWGQAVLNGVTGKTLNGIASGAGRYILVGAKGKIIASAGNLQSWSAVISPTADRLDDVIFANNLFVAVGENGTILTSSDGLGWTNQTRGANHDLDGLAVANGLAVAVGKGGAILTSTDGAAWSYRQAPGGASLHGVAYGNSQWVAVGDSTNIFTSVNGLNWTAHWPGFSFSYLKSVLYANNLWVAVGTNGQIITSPDALSWTTQYSPVAYDLNEVTYGKGLFVVVGDNNFQPNATILTSSDGVAWDYHGYGSGKNARAIAFANDQFVLGLNDGVILYGSTPALPYAAWQYGGTGISQNGANLRGVTWGNSLWVAVGNDGRILTSTNAATWRQRLAPTYENLHAVRLLNNTFIAIGNAGTILQSAPLVPQVSLLREDGQLRLLFSSPYEGVFKLQQTDNFIWSDLADITNTVGTAEYVVPLPPGSGQKFFRVIAP